MTFTEFYKVIPDWQPVKLMGFEYLDWDEYELARYDGKNSIPYTFDVFEVTEIDTETDDGETWLKVRVDTNSSYINQLIYRAYNADDFNKAEIRDQHGDLIESTEIPEKATQEWITMLMTEPIYKSHFEAVRDADGILEFTIYREENE